MYKISILGIYKAFHISGFICIYVLSKLACLENSISTAGVVIMFFPFEHLHGNGGLISHIKQL